MPGGRPPNRRRRGRASSRLLQRVDGRTRGPHALESIETFRVAEEEVTLRLEPVEQAMDDAALRLGVEVDQDVAAKDRVEAAGDRVRVVMEVHASEADQGPQLVARGDVSLLG